MRKLIIPIRVHRFPGARIATTLLLLNFFIIISAQGKFSVTAGWGYYELTNIGVQWNISEISSLSVFCGTNFGLNDRKLWSAGLSFDQTFQKTLFWKLKPGYSFGTYYWTSDDDLYYFSSMSLPVMILLSYPVSPALSLRAEGGWIFNYVIDSDRKQNVEAGYPARGNGNVRVSVIYKFGAK
jgi:hypothetical protein